MSHRKANPTARWRQTALGAAAALVLSACGSTAQHMLTIDDSGRANGVTDDGLSLADPDRGFGNGGSEATTPGGPGELGDMPKGEKIPGTRAGTPGMPGTRAGTAGNPAGTKNTPRPGTSGRGFTEKEIYIGFETFKNAETAYRQAGVSGQFGDQEAQGKAVVKDINDRGGVAGRKLVLVFHDVQTEQILANPAGGAQATCERWTHDRPVFAALTKVGYGGDSSLTACLAQRNTPQVHQGGVLRPQSVYSRFAPYLYTASWTTMERLTPVWMQRLKARSYFHGGWDVDLTRPGREPTKVGVLSRRDLYGTDFRRIVRAELSRLSRPVAAEAEWSGNFSTRQNEMDQAVLNFRDAGVTHVIIAGGNEFLAFMNSAEAQKYRPRYAINSFSFPLNKQGNAPSGQLSGAMGIGWYPTYDVDKARDPGNVSRAQTKCQKVMQEAGQNTSNRDTFALMLGVCDGLHFMAEAIEKGGLSPEGMRRGIQAMGAMPPASVFRIGFPRGRFDGAAAVRDLVYRDDCTCFKYVSDKNYGI